MLIIKICDFLKKSKNFAYIALFIIMIILLFHTGMTLFVETANPEVATSVDIVIRTTLSSIFGFLLTTLVNRGETKVIKVEYKQKAIQKKSIFFKNIVVLIAAIICIYSLVIILIARNVKGAIASSNSSIATISQYRDFISTSIGSLIAMTKNSDD